MRQAFLSLFLLGAVTCSPVFAQQQSPIVLTATSETAFGSIAAAYAEKLAIKTYVYVDVVNDTNCDVQIQFDDLTGTPDTVVPKGTAINLDFGALNSYVTSSVKLQYMSGETCSSGSVYIQGGYK